MLISLLKAEWSLPWHLFLSIFNKLFCVWGWTDGQIQCQFKKDKPDEKRHKIIITGDIHKKGYATEVQHNVENRYERSRSSEARIRLGSSNKKILKNRQKLCDLPTLHLCVRGYKKKQLLFPYKALLYPHYVKNASDS